jgi:hypothetical protein
VEIFLLYVLAIILVFFTFYLASLAGFGSSALSVAFLAFLFDVKVVVPVLVLLSFVFNLVLIKENYDKVDKKIIIPLLAGNFFGNVVGVFFLKEVEADFLVRLLGLIIIVFSLDLFFRKKKSANLNHRKSLGSIAGFFSGITEIMFSISSPPIIFYLSSFIHQKEILRSTIVGFFFFASGFSVVALLFGGLLDLEVASLTAALIPSAVLGTYFGNKKSLNFSESDYKKIIGSVLLFSGLILFIKG